MTATIVAAIDESKGYTDTQLADYSTTAQMTQAISDALVPFETAVQRDAAIAAALAAYYTSAQTDAALAAGLVPYSTTAQMNQAIADALTPQSRRPSRPILHVGPNGRRHRGGHRPLLHLGRNGCRHRGGAAEQRPDLERRADVQPAAGSNVLRNLSVAGALTASFQNLDDTILIESDSYARSETYTQAETGAAITAAIDALDLSQFQNEAEVQALIDAALSTYVAGELANYATSSSVTSAISAALSRRQQPGRFQDHHGSVGFLHPDRSRSRDCQCAGERGSVELLLLHPGRDVAGELLAYYFRTELDSQLTATFLQYWTSSRTQTEIDDAIAGAGFLTQAQADTRRSAPTEASSPWCAPT